VEKKGEASTAAGVTDGKGRQRRDEVGEAVDEEDGRSTMYQISKLSLFCFYFY
jgi:hypothetical protein